MVVAGLRFGRIRFSMERAQDVGASLMIASVAVFLPSIYAESRRHLPTPQMSIDYVGEISIGSLRPAPDPLRCRNGSHRAASKGADLAGHGRRAQPVRTERRCDEHGVGDRAACHFQPAGGASVGVRRRLGRRRQQSPGWTDLSDGSDRNRCGHERGAWGLYRAAGADSHGEKRFGVLYGVYLLETRQIWAP